MYFQALWVSAPSKSLLFMLKNTGKVEEAKGNVCFHMIILRTKGTGKHIFKQTEQITRIALLNQRSLENARDALSKCSNLMMHTLRSSKCSNATLKLYYLLILDELFCNNSFVPKKTIKKYNIPIFSLYMYCPNFYSWWKIIPVLKH